MSQAPMDPYDYAASRLPTEARAAIREFWEHFECHADGLDRCFSSRMEDMSTDPSEVMMGLQEVSPDLMWEFGPAENGHSLCVTAEWRDELRPLARAMRNMAPELPRWRFLDARGPGDPTEFSAENFKARFRLPLTLALVTPELGAQGRIDVVGHGRDRAGGLADQAAFAATMLLGEEVERDWLGYCDGMKMKVGFLGRFSRDVAEFDAGAFVNGFRAEIARAKSALPTRPYAEQDVETSPTTLYGLGQMPKTHRRSDLITYSAPSEAFAQAVLASSRFSSRCHSTHGEWFLYVRVSRSAEMPFDGADERHELEEKLHNALAANGLGGHVAGGHGREAIYIDLAVVDVGLGVERIAATLRDEGYARDATIHFLDQGLADLSPPVLPATEKFH